MFKNSDWFETFKSSNFGAVGDSDKLDVMIDTLPETNSSHLKMDVWKTNLSFYNGPFSGAFAVSFGQGKYREYETVVHPGGLMAGSYKSPFRMEFI